MLTPPTRIKWKIIPSPQEIKNADSKVFSRGSHDSAKKTLKGDVESEAEK